jgi:hypothetical protein
VDVLNCGRFNWVSGRFELRTVFELSAYSPVFGRDTQPKHYMDILQQIENESMALTNL